MWSSTTETVEDPIEDDEEAEKSDEDKDEEEKEEDEDELIESINTSGAKVLLVAMGSPKQELWIDRNQDKLQVGWIQGVGGSFDVHSGFVMKYFSG